jgi:hypothetical protein
MVSRMLFCFIALAPTAGAQEAESLTLRGTLHLTPGANPYYLNNNRDDGGVLVGQIGFGARWIDRKGKELKSLTTKTTPPLLPSVGAKCLVRLGDDCLYVTSNGGKLSSFRLGSREGGSRPLEESSAEPATSNRDRPNSVGTRHTTMPEQAYL